MAEPLPKPFNYLFRKGGRRAGSGLRFAILAYLEGVATISPKSTGEAIEIPVTRLYIQRLDRVSPARYYDISSRQVQAQLSGYLSNARFRRAPIHGRRARLQAVEAIQSPRDAFGGA